MCRFLFQFKKKEKSLLFFNNPYNLTMWKYPLWGRIGFDVDEEAKVAGRGAAGLVKSGTVVIADDNYAYAYAA